MVQLNRQFHFAPNPQDLWDFQEYKMVELLDFIPQIILFILLRIEYFTYHFMILIIAPLSKPLLV